MTLDSQRAKSLFLAAADRPIQERPAFLDEACASEAELRRRVEQLLEAHDRPDSLPEAPPDVGPTRDSSPHEGRAPAGLAESPGAPIGPYKLLQQLGEGGMGAVYLAEQSQPVRRMVALKIIKPGMDSRQVVARFEAERQALALMDHPNIARVFDGGTTDSGRPYFVMELVKGVPITRFCDEHRLTPRQRLELFLPVCQAVQHAHQKGVIHRDLKPSNVMVCLYDGKPAPKVIDFGIAKATDQKLTERTMFTEIGQVVGTLEYMSPEQAELNQLDVDTRSDVYSLGVLLYELLTGSTPLERKRLKAAGMLEVLRLIREEEPPKPSTRLSEAKDTLPAISAQRQTEPARLAKLVRGELDWIVMKALEKDRNRRYETANGFALDVQRYLADEPVLACPPSAWYRFRKFARRRRRKLTVAGLILFFMALLGGGGGWVIRDRQVREQEAAKELRDRERRLTDQVELTLREEERLEREQKWPEALAAIKQLEAALPQGEIGPAIWRRVRDVSRDVAFAVRLDRIRQDHLPTKDYDGKLNSRRAAREYAWAFREYGVDVEVLPVEEVVARLQARPALAVQIVAALDDWFGAARILSTDGSTMRLVAVARGLDPEPLRDRLRAMWGQPPTPELRAGVRRVAEAIDVKAQTPETLIPLAVSLGAFRLAEFQLRILREGQFAYPGNFWLNVHLAVALSLQKDYVGAERYASAAVSLRPDSAIGLDLLGENLAYQKKSDEAIACYRKAIEIDQTLVRAHNNLGKVLLDQGKLDQAIVCLQRAVEIDPDQATTHSNLGAALRLKKDLKGAMREFRTAVKIDPNNGNAHLNLGLALEDKKDLEGAVREFHAALKIDPNLVNAHINLGGLLRDRRKDLEGALREFHAALKIDPDNALAHYGLGVVLRDKQDLDGAVREYRAALKIDPNLVNAHINLGVLLRDKQDLDGAVREYRAALKIDPNHVQAHNGLGTVLCDKKDLDGAAREYQAALKIDPDDTNAHYGLGNTLREKQDLEGAMREYRAALKIDPNHVQAHCMLGVALLARQDLEGAIREFEAALKIDPNHFQSHGNLGAALFAKKDLEGAVCEFRAVLKIDPNLAAAHHYLALVLQQKGEFREALAEFRRAHELGSQGSIQSAEKVRECERLVELDGKLPGILQGKTKPASPRERIELAHICSIKRLHPAAAGFYEKALAEEPKLADDLTGSHRYNAACAAALAGCGQGKDANKLDDKERARLRRLALDWLRADRKAWGRLLDTGPDKGRLVIARQMRHWQVDTDFAGVRGPGALAKLPEAERKEWQKLWDEVATTLAKAHARTGPAKKSDAK